MFHDLFNQPAMKERLDRLDKPERRVLSGLNPGVTTPVRQLKNISIPQVEAVSAKLASLFPNFHEANDIIVDALMLSAYGGSHGIKLPTLLLHGDPGIGKSFYVRQLAKLLNLPHRKLNFANVTAGMVLTGTSSKWGNCDVGAIALFLMQHTISNGIFYFDEVDKGAAASSYNSSFGGSIENCLIDLLEKTEAKEFFDEFIDLPIDASHINYFMIGNDIEMMPDYIISRCETLEVKLPSQEQMGIITRAIYQELLSEYGISDFSESLTDSTIEALTTKSSDLRSYKRSLTKLLSMAIKNNEKSIRTEYVYDLPDTKQPTKVGFM